MNKISLNQMIGPGCYRVRKVDQGAVMKTEKQNMFIIHNYFAGEG